MANSTIRKIFEIYKPININGFQVTRDSSEKNVYLIWIYDDNKRIQIGFSTTEISRKEYDGKNWTTTWTIPCVVGE